MPVLASRELALTFLCPRHESADSHVTTDKIRRLPKANGVFSGQMSA